MIYSRKVHYYETDKMGIVHHSNYIRWMEEARIAFLDYLGFGFDKLEKEGAISPVVNISCHYKKPVTFADVIEIDIFIKDFSGIKLVFGYKMMHENTLVCEAESLHCFINSNGRPIKLKDSFPDFYNKIMENISLNSAINSSDS